MVWLPHNFHSFLAIFGWVDAFYLVFQLKELTEGISAGLVFCKLRGAAGITYPFS